MTDTMTEGGSNMTDTMTVKEKNSMTDTMTEGGSNMTDTMTVKEEKQHD